MTTRLLQQPSESYHGYRTAGIRLTRELVGHAAGIRSGMREDVFPAVHVFDQAHLVMLTEEGLIPRQDGIAMLRALREMEAEGVSEARERVGGGQHSAENYLIRKLGEEVGGRVHLGRSSGDLGAVTNRVCLRDRLLETMEGINQFRQVVLDLGERHLETVMPSYAHGRHAQVVSFAFVMEEWACVLERDFQRFRNLYRRVNTSPAGCTVGTGTNFPLNRHRTAALIGFDTLFESTLDGIHTQDHTLEAYTCLAIYNADLARFADDLMSWSTDETRMLDFPDEYCGTSSIMMQKKNPYATEILKGAAAETVGSMTSAFLVHRGPSHLAVLDWRFPEAALWRAFDNTTADLQMLRGILEGMTVQTERMAELAASYWAAATDVGAALVREKGLPWRTAHQIFGTMARLAAARGLRPQDAGPALLDEAAQEYMGQSVGLDEATWRAALDPLAFIRARDGIGGTAPHAVSEAIAESRASLAADNQTLDQARTRLRQAAAELEQAIDHLLAGEILPSP